MIAGWAQRVAPPDACGFMRAGGCMWVAGCGRADCEWVAAGRLVAGRGARFPVQRVVAAKEQHPENGVKVKEQQQQHQDIEDRVEAVEERLVCNALSYTM